MAHNQNVSFGKGFSSQATSNLLKTFTSKFVSEELFVDLINVCLYPAAFGTVTVGSTNSTVEYLRDYLIDVAKVVRPLKLSNTSIIMNNINLVNTLFTIRESGSNILGYNNVFQHVPSQDVNSQRLMKRAIDEQIKSVDEFRKKTDYILNMINLYYEISDIRAHLVLLGNFEEYSSGGDITPFEVAKNYKELVINMYNDLSKLQSVNKAESISDYFVISDKKSSMSLADTLFSYVSQEYSFFQTGFELFDRFIEGFESSSVHLVSAPSNHGKSIFMINLCHMMARINAADFQPNEAIVFVTLEDDIYKLSRRFMSVFGNYKYNLLRTVFKQSYEISKATEIMDASTTMGVKIKSMFKNLLDTSVTALTNGKFGIIIKHASENSFSPGDLGKFFDRLRVEGWKVKMCFMDYVDCANPTIMKYTSVKDYDVHGQIVQELRNLSREHKIPIITATQNAKISENMNMAMDNSMIGDSYKKVRYTDYLYMCRMRRDLKVLATPVLDDIIDPAKHLTNNELNPEIVKMTKLIEEVLIPFEVKITKSKESGKDVSRFALFCVENLRIYNNLQEFIDDAKYLYSVSKRLEQDINSITDLALTSVSEDFDNDPESYQPMNTQQVDEVPEFLA